jgi:hypothetical protein
MTTLPLSFADYLKKSGSLNLMEPSGPIKACNWIALPLHIQYMYVCKQQVLSILNAFFFRFP